MSSATKFEGDPISSLRNLHPSYFLNDEVEVYINEDSAYGLPFAAIPEDVLTVEVLDDSKDTLPIIHTSESKLGNKDLPIYPFRNEIVQTIRDNPVTIIVAETGSGKSTQVPQFLLDEGWDKIILTQPRRAAAENVYLRISDEIDSMYGLGTANELVSFKTAVKHSGSENPIIEVLTDGLHLVKTLHDQGIQEHQVLIIDEVHEWNSNIEVVVALAKKQIKENPNLRVVIMSATVDAQDLAAYFSDATDIVSPIIEVPGRIHNIQKIERPNSTVFKEIISGAKEFYATNRTKIGTQNSILAFVPGKKEIYDLIDDVKSSLPLEIARIANIFPLHSKLQNHEQQLAINSHNGINIIVSTNIAQTSLTIAEVGLVITCGLGRQVEIDVEGIQGLFLKPLSQADLNQQGGRTGRVADGTWIDTVLNEKFDYVYYEDRDDYPVPEILRTDIVRNVLRLSEANINMAVLDLPHPIEVSSIEKSQEILRTLGALDIDNSITSMGTKMNKFPIRVNLSRMMVESERYSSVTRTYMAVIAGSVEAGGLQNFGRDIPKLWQTLTEDTSSDLLAQLDIYIALQNMTRNEMVEHGIDVNNYDKAQEIIVKLYKRIGVEPAKLLAPKEEERLDIKKSIFAGSVHSIYLHEGSGTYKHISGTGNIRELSNRSVVVKPSPQFVVGDGYRIEVYKDGERQEKHIIQNVTGLTIRNIGEVAMRFCVWKSSELILRNDRVVEIQRLSFEGHDLGLTQEIIAEPSQKAREFSIQKALDSPGKNQRKLREIKSELEKLAHLSKDEVRKLTHNDIVNLVERATKNDTVVPYLIDQRLGEIIRNEKISLETYIDRESVESILRNSPEIISVEDAELVVTYRNSSAFVRVSLNDRETIFGFKEELFLPDGRQIRFIYKNKYFTLIELQHRFQNPY